MTTGLTSGATTTTSRPRKSSSRSATGSSRPTESVPHDVHDGFDRRLVHRRAERQRAVAIGYFGCHRKPVGRGELAVLGERVQRRVPRGLNAVGFELVAKAVACRAVLEQNGKGEMRRALNRLIVECELDPCDACEPLPVGPHDRAT